MTDTLRPYDSCIVLVVSGARNAVSQILEAAESGSSVESFVDVEFRY